ncbi:MAG: DUF29 domain-containing protein [Cyanobacteriota bacterium]|jgi:hypothetical protein
MLIAMALNQSLYEQDFYTWTSEQAQALAQRRVELLDWEHLAQELVFIGASEKNEIKNRLVVLLSHLLKWCYQPSKRSISWFTTIANQRDDLQDLLTENPGLRQFVPGLLVRAYRNARREAAAETGLRAETFPEDCSYVIEQVLNAEFICDTSADFEWTVRKGDV